MRFTIIQHCQSSPCQVSSLRSSNLAMMCHAFASMVAVATRMHTIMISTWCCPVHSKLFNTCLYPAVIRALVFKMLCFHFVQLSWLPLKLGVPCHRDLQCTWLLRLIVPHLQHPKDPICNHFRNRCAHLLHTYLVYYQLLLQSYHNIGDSS